MSNSQEQQGKTNNDVAWEKIFQDYSVLDRLSQDGFFEIDSATINCKNCWGNYLLVCVNLCP
ncbi:type II restriction enzyme [Coleofasciculus sp. C1-SOL-03]|jgi:hypothetical protein|uniref:type II restriction enzyme n=1 Tax=Coleofasciculus sp. C1-SOL-03 TaxID=3069522 RepID=UPI0040636759